VICVFDCETIPDANLIRKVFGYEGDDKSVSLQALKMQEEKSGSSFLPITFHKVVAISAVIADDFGHFSRVNSLEGEKESELIGSFLSFLDKKSPKLISYNGRSFDMPMLMSRALAYNLSCPTYFDTKSFGKSKWENYRSRYSDSFHIDLMDHLSDFGAVRGLKLDEVCKMCNLPGKFDTKGDDVITLFYDNELDKIRAYCESDALNTYWLFLKYELLKGNLTLQDYASSLLSMQKTLGENSPFYAYIQNEINFLEH